MNYRKGDKATCASCNCPIVFDFLRNGWQHDVEAGYSPKHPAIPLETTHLNVSEQKRLRLAQALFDLTRFLLQLTDRYNLSIAEIVYTLLCAAYDFQKQEVHKHDQ